MIEVRQLNAAETYHHLPSLAAILADCVEGGASVNFLLPFTTIDAERFFTSLLPAISTGRRVLLAAFSDHHLVGTVQLVPATPPNQPHRADVAKLLVHRSARNSGVGTRLMLHLEDAARALGKTLLVLDTVTGDPAERLYTRLGWNPLGSIPNYALYPDGRPCATTVFWKAVSPTPLE